MGINYAIFDDEYHNLWDKGIRVIQVDKVFDQMDFNKLDKLFLNPFYAAFFKHIENAEYLGNALFYSHTFKHKFPYIRLSTGSKLIGLLLSDAYFLETDYLPLASVGPNMTEWFYTLVSEKSKTMQLNILLNNLQVSVNSVLDVGGSFVNTALEGHSVQTPLDIAAHYAALSDHVDSGDSLQECIDFWEDFFKKDVVPPDNFETTFRRSGGVAKKVIL